MDYRVVITEDAEQLLLIIFFTSYKIIRINCTDIFIFQKRAPITK